MVFKVKDLGKDLIDGLAGFKIHSKRAYASFDGEDDKDSRTLDDDFKRRIENAAKHGAHRLKDVFAAPLDMIADFVPPVYPKSESERKFINDALGDSFVFAHLSNKERRAMVDAFESCAATKGEKIISQGEVGDFFYVIQQGNINFVVDGKAVGNASAGGSFGEIALLYDCPRAATCIAETDCKLWRVGQKTFRRILASYSIQNDDETKALLTKVPFLADLDDATLTKVAYALSTVEFKKGDAIAKKEDENVGQTFCIIKKGKIEITDIEVEGGVKYSDFTLGPGECFGEAAITSNTRCLANISALEDGTMLCMDRLYFTKLLGNFSDLMQQSQDKKKLMSIPYGNKPTLQSHEVNTLASLIVNKDFKKGHVFFTEGSSADPCLFLVRSGKVSINTSFLGIEFLTGIKVKKGDTKFIPKDGFFGEDTLDKDFWADGVAFPMYTATAAEDCSVGVLTMKAIKTVLLQREGKVDIGLDEMEKFTLLGAGTFGKVWLVAKKGTKKDAYALKVQNKRQLIKYGQAQGVIRERDIMAKLDHPFIIKLVNSYQDDSNVYMLMKLYQGGELRSIMHSRKRHSMPEWAARFYVAGVLEGLSHMHHRHILFRDLKPENVLLDSDGYCVIVDLGFAKIVPNKTYTFCGTPLYLAPEVILQKGHDKGADHWSWAVMLYEMIVGITPFYDGEIDQKTLFKRIVNGQFDFPSGNYMSSSSKDLLRRMLVVKPKERLGGFVGADVDIRRHIWFEGLDWEKLSKKEIKSPWKPKVKDPFDASNFSNWDDTEEKEEKRAPLTSKEQKLFKDF